MRLNTATAPSIVLVLCASYSGFWFNGTCLLTITSHRSSSSTIWNRRPWEGGVQSTPKRKSNMERQCTVNTSCTVCTEYPTLNIKARQSNEKKLTPHACCRSLRRQRTKFVDQSVVRSLIPYGVHSSCDLANIYYT